MIVFFRISLCSWEYHEVYHWFIRFLGVFFMFFCITLHRTLIQYFFFGSPVHPPLHIVEWSYNALIGFSTRTLTFPVERVLLHDVTVFSCVTRFFSRLMVSALCSSLACPWCSVAVLVSCFCSSEKDKCVFSPSQRDHSFPAGGSCVTCHLIVFRALRGLRSCAGLTVFLHTHTQNQMPHRVDFSYTFKGPPAFSSSVY